MSRITRSGLRARATAAVALATVTLHGAPGATAPQAYDVSRIDTSLAFASACTAEASVELRRGASLLFFALPDAALVAFERAGELDHDCALAGWGEAMAWARLPAFDTSEVASTRGRASLRRAAASSPGSRRDARLIGVTEALFDAATPSPALRVKTFGDGMHGLAHAEPANVLALGSAVLSDLVRTTLPDDAPVRSARDRIAHAYPDAAAMPLEMAFLRLLVADDAAGETMAVAARLTTAVTPTPLTAHAAARVFHRVGHWGDALDAADAAHRAAGGWFEATMVTPVAWLGAVPEWAVVAAAQGGRFDRAAAIARGCPSAIESAGVAIDARLASRVSRACARASTHAWFTDIDWQSALPSGTPPALPAGTASTADAEPEALWWLARGLQQARDAWPRGQPELIAGARAAMARLDALAEAHPARARASELDRLLVAMALAGAFESRDELLVFELQAGDLERVIDASRQEAPRLVGVDRLAGELHLRLHDYRDAREHFTRALARQPNDTRALLGLARAASRQGDVAAARDAAQRLLALWPDADPTRAEVVDAARLAK